MADLETLKIPIVPGVNDDPEPPNSGGNGRGCNGSYLVEKHNELVDQVENIVLTVDEDRDLNLLLYASSAQGKKADTALQPEDIGVSVQAYDADTVVDADYVHTDNNYTIAEKNKLGLIAHGAEVNVNADWNAISGDSQILNKPIIVNSVASKSGVVILVKADVGLDNVDNTSDINKPISTAAQTALNVKADLIEGKVPTSQMPSLAITEYLGTVSSSAQLLTLVGQRGDWAIRSDTGSTWVLITDGGSLIGHWVEIASPADAVSSVNGHTGAIILGPSDIAAATAAQGAIADTALQPEDIGVTVQSYSANTVIDADYVATEENYTTNEKTKLAGIESEAQVNIPTDLTYTAASRLLASSTGADATLPEVIAAGTSGLMTGADKTKLDAITGTNTGDQDLSSYQVKPTEGAFVNGDKTKLDGIAAGAEVNVQSDWTAASGDAHILNKPTLATVATSGAYTDLSGLPTLGTAAATAITDYATAAQGTLANTAVQPAAITDFETTIQLNARDTNNRARANHTGTQLAATISDFQPTVSANTDVAANTSARHVAVTVVDSSEIDFTLTGQQITASLINTAVTPATYGSASTVPSFTVDAKGRITAASNTTIALPATALTSGTLPNARMPALTGDVTTTVGSVSTTLSASTVLSKLLTVDGNGSGLDADLLDGLHASAFATTGQVRELLTADRTYYVRTDGNDSNNGLTDSSSGAFLTIQKAIDVVASLDVSTYNAVIIVRDGTYAEGLTLKQPPGAGTNCFIQGNSSDVTAVTIAGAVTVGITDRWNLTWVTLNTANTPISVSGGYLNTSNIRSIGSSFAFASVSNNGRLNLSSTITIQGALTHVFSIQTAGLVAISSATLVVTGTSITGNFVDLRANSVCYVRTTTIDGIIDTGRKYSVSLNSVIDTAGAGTSFFPGLNAGITTTGGEYA